MCSITSNDKQKPTYVDGESSAGSIEIYNNETTAALKLLDATLNFIDFWIRHFQHNYQERLEMYYEGIIELFKQIPNMKSKPLSWDIKHQLILSDIGDVWYMKNA